MGIGNMASSLKQKAISRLRALKLFHIDSVTVQRSLHGQLEVIWQPTPPPGALGWQIRGNELHVEFFRRGTLGNQIVVYPGLHLIYCFQPDLWFAAPRQISCSKPRKAKYGRKAT
jgi:hypothetical protein